MYELLSTILPHNVGHPLRPLVKLYGDGTDSAFDFITFLHWPFDDVPATKPLPPVTAGVRSEGVDVNGIHIGTITERRYDR